MDRQTPCSRTPCTYQNQLFSLAYLHKVILSHHLFFDDVLFYFQRLKREERPFALHAFKIHFFPGLWPCSKSLNKLVFAKLTLSLLYCIYFYPPPCSDISFVCYQLSHQHLAADQHSGRITEAWTNICTIVNVKRRCQVAYWTICTTISFYKGHKSRAQTVSGLCSVKTSRSAKSQFDNTLPYSVTHTLIPGPLSY